MPIQQKRLFELRGVDAPFQSTPRNTRGVRRRLNRDTLLGWDEAVGGRLNRTLSRNKTIRPRNRARSRTRQPGPLNRWAWGDRPTSPTVPLPTAHHPEHAVERGYHDSQTGHEENDTRVDDEILHNEAHRAGARTTATTRKPMLGAHTARVVERARKRDTVTKTHFRYDLSSWVG